MVTSGEVFGAGGPMVVTGNAATLFAAACVADAAIWVVTGGGVAAVCVTTAGGVVMTCEADGAGVAAMPVDVARGLVHVVAGDGDGVVTGGNAFEVVFGVGAGVVGKARAGVAT